MHTHNSRGSCVQRVDRLEGEFHQLSSSPKVRKRIRAPPCAADTTLKPYQSAARSLRMQGKAAQKLVEEAHDMPSRNESAVGREFDQSIENMLDMFTWSTTQEEEETNKKPPNNERRRSAEDMLEMFVWSNEFAKKENQATSLKELDESEDLDEVSEDEDYELPLQQAPTAECSTKRKKKTKKSRTRRSKKSNKCCEEEFEIDQNHNSFAETVLVSNVSQKVNVNDASDESSTEAVVVSNFGGNRIKGRGTSGYVTSKSLVRKTIAKCNRKRVKDKLTRAPSSAASSPAA